LPTQQLLNSALIVVVFALQPAQLLALHLQLLLDLPTLLVHAVTLDAQQIDAPTNDRLGSQQRQQLAVIQHAVIRPMTDQQPLQRRLLFLEAGLLLQQWLQLPLDTQHRLFAALPTKLTEGQQASSIKQ
jgi:hypothetical protein